MTVNLESAHKATYKKLIFLNDLRIPCGNCLLIDTQMTLPDMNFTLLLVMKKKTCSLLVK